jgi:hypothetical protein
MLTLRTELNKHINEYVSIEEFFQYTSLIYEQVKPLDNWIKIMFKVFEI